MGDQTYWLKRGDNSLADEIPMDEFDMLVDDGYETIVVTTPRGRYVSSVDDWLDLGYNDLTDADEEVRVLSRSYMTRS